MVWYPQNMRRFLLVLGGLFVAAALGIFAYQAIDNGATADDIEAQHVEKDILVESWAELEPEIPAETPVTTQPGTFEEFGVIYVPRWGKEYVAPIVEGDRTKEVSSWLGVDHYPLSAMPGELGNFALAAHNGRNDTGRFSLLKNSKPGDEVFVETADGWYEYRLEEFEVITPDQNEVLYPVPRQKGATPTESIITLVSCTPSPFGGPSDRLVGRGHFVTFTPRLAGPPEAVTALQ